MTESREVEDYSQKYGDVVEVVFDLGEAHWSGLRYEILRCVSVENLVLKVNESPIYIEKVKYGDHIRFEVIEERVDDEVYLKWHFREVI